MRGLPHAFPFRFVETGRNGESARALISVGDALRRGSTQGHPPILLLEILAQAALVPAGPQPEGEGEGPAVNYLAAINDARFAPELATAPVQPGDVLEARVEAVGGFGRTLKVHGELEREGQVLVEATLILVTPPS